MVDTFKSVDSQHDDEKICVPEGENVEDFVQLLKEHKQTSNAEGHVVRGKVIGVEKDSVIFDVGLKSEGRVPMSELSTDGTVPSVSIGDEMDVYVEKIDGRAGLTILSREKALRDEAWRKFEELCQKNIDVEGVVVGRVRGGFAVELGGIVAFLPGSQVDIRPVTDISSIMHVQLPFKILKMDKAQGNVVVSRRAILEESRKEAKEELLSVVKEGMILDGVVKNITDYGAFIDLKSTDGLLHITDISWSKISHPSDVLELKQKIKVVVTKYDPETQRISLGLKQLEKNPWDGLKDKFAKGTRHKGVITTTTDYGAFVELEKGIEGLVYHTEIHWLARNVHPKKLLQSGQEVEVLVLDIDIARHRIGLSIKRCLASPLVEFAQSYPEGTKVSCAVRNVTDFGIFVVLEEEKDIEYALNILIPAAELVSAEDKPGVATGPQDYKKGDILECTIFNIDSERERVTATAKQYVENPLIKVVEKLKLQPMIPAIVCGIQTDGMTVKMEDGTLGTINKSELSLWKESCSAEQFSIGESVEAKFLSFDKRRNKIYLSIKALQKEEQNKGNLYADDETRETLGSMLKDTLASKK